MLSTSLFDLITSRLQYNANVYNNQGKVGNKIIPAQGMVANRMKDTIDQAILVLG